MILEDNNEPNIILDTDQEAPDPQTTPEATITAVPTRNQHLKKNEPKIKQFTGRCTEAEADRINRALQVRKREGHPYDIVRLVLDCLNHIENDIFQSFKTK